MNIVPNIDRRIMVDPIEKILDAARQGRPYVLIDDEDRENEGDVILPAQFATADIIAFMAKQASGLICVTLTATRAAQLGLVRATPINSNCPRQTAFTQSIEASSGITTGISAADRARTIAAVIDPISQPDEISSPGHMFPLIAKDGGVLERPGHTEASVDISRICGLNPSAVICEIMMDDGRMARLPELREWADYHQMPLGTIRDLICWRLRNDPLDVTVKRSNALARSTRTDWLAIEFSGIGDGVHLLEMNEYAPNVEQPRPLWIGSSGDSDAARTSIFRHVNGVVVITLGIGAALAADGRPTEEGFAIAARMLRQVGIDHVRVPSTQAELISLRGHGIKVAEQEFSEINHAVRKD